MTQLPPPLPAPAADASTASHTAWGAPPSARYEALAERWRPVFARIRDGAVERDLQHRLPHEEIAWLRAADFLRLRLPAAHGGAAVTLPELFGLLTELAAADTNVVNAVRAHFGVVEDVLNAPPSEWRSTWLQRLERGELIGGGLSEAAGAKVGSFATRLARTEQGLVLTGRKFYTTGSLFADWIAVGAIDDNEAPVFLQVPRHAPGVEVLDDWDGFGQALSASGTAIFTAVAIEPGWLRPQQPRFAYASAFYQLVHLASLAGLGRALAQDVALRVRQRDRVYSHGNAAQVAQDPQILQVVGRAHAAAYGAGAVARHAAQALQRAYDAHRDAAVSEAQRQAAAVDAHVEVDQSVSVVTRLILDASTELFDALGASATLRSAGLDRYWRNARTITSHNPRIYRERQVGAYAVNGTPPPSSFLVGKGG